MKDLGDVYLILGMQVSRDRLKGTLNINQGNCPFCTDAGLSTADR